MPGKKVASELAVRIGADTSGLKRGLQSADGALKKLGNAGKIAGVALAAGIAAATAAVVALTKAGLSAIDAQTKLARTLGGTHDGLRAVQIAAADAGADMGIINGALERMQSRLGEALRNPLSQAARGLDRLGLSAADLADMDVDERLAVISDRVKELGLGAAETGDFLRQLGIRNGELINLLRDGGDAFRKAREEVDEFGLSVSEVDAAKVEAANDAMARIRRHLEGIRNQLAVALAPILTEVADRINSIARENGGWADVAQDAANRSIRAFAKVADVVQGLRVALKAAELIGVGFGAAMVSASQLAVEAMSDFIDFALKGVNAVIDGLNKIPKVDIAKVDLFSDSEFVQGFRRFANEARDKVGEVRSELHDLAMQPLPSSQAEELLERVQQRAQEAAEAVVNARHENDDSGPAGIPEDVQKRLDQIRERFKTERQLADEKLAADQEALNESLEAEIITREEHHALLEQLREEHQKRLTEIDQAAMTEREKFEAMTAKQKTAHVLGSLEAMTAGVAQHSKKMFKLNKLAAIGNAVMNTAQAVTKALAEYPPPISFAMAAAQAAAGLAQVNAIKKTTFAGSGGGTTPSAAGSTPTVNGQPTQAAQQQLVTIKGLDPSHLFTGRQVVDLFNEAVKDGAKVVFA